MAVRTMEHTDLAAVSDLAVELGYKLTMAEMAERFSVLLKNADHIFLVNESPDGAIVGWIHANIHQTLLSDSRVEIAALVVTQRQRGKGLGKALVQKVEDWARDRRISKLRLGSRIQRTEAHQFYQKLGFVIEKTWHVFTKDFP